MSNKSDPFNQLVVFVLSVIFAMLIVQMIIGFLVQTIGLLWMHTFGSMIGQIVGPLVVFVLLGLFGLGIIVRLGKDLGSFWQGILERFHGRQKGRGTRTRGAEHLPRIRRRRRPVDDDPALPGGRGK